MQNSRPEHSAFKRKLASIRRRFLAALPGKVALCSELAQTGIAATDTAETASRRLERELHDMSGSAGMLGCPEIGVEARAAVTVVAQADRKNRSLEPDERAAVLEHLGRIRDFAREED